MHFKSILSTRVDVSCSRSPVSHFHPPALDLGFPAIRWGYYSCLAATVFAANCACVVRLFSFVSHFVRCSRGACSQRYSPEHTDVDVHLSDRRVNCHSRVSQPIKSYVFVYMHASECEWWPSVSGMKCLRCINQQRWVDGRRYEMAFSWYVSLKRVVYNQYDINLEWTAQFLSHLLIRLRFLSQLLGFYLLVPNVFHCHCILNKTLFYLYFFAI